jgi:hypothetical protein
MFVRIRPINGTINTVLYFMGRLPFIESDFGNILDIVTFTVPIHGFLLRRQ